VPFGSAPVLLVRTPAGELRAFSATCTHLDCTVQYRPDLEHVWCACHNGHYDLEGRNIAGPPPRPLTPFDINLNGDEIVISRRA
jgi:Rieske Fe-S protein